MMGRFPVFAVVCGALSVGVAGADAAVLGDAGQSDVQDIVYFGASRPVRIRVHLLIDGKPFREVWKSEVERLFGEFDADMDGKIATDDADRIRDRLSGVYAAASARPNVATTQVTIDEVFARLSTPVPPVNILHGIAAGRGAGPALFPLLDLDRNGRLSVDELRQAKVLTKPRDFNDDQVVTDQELILDFEAGLPGPTLVTPPPGASGVSGVGAILPLKADNREQVGVGLIAVYSQESKDDQQVENVAGKRTDLDRDKNGAIEPEEAADYLGGRPDVELYVGLGRTMSSRERSPRSGASEIRVRKKLDGGFKLSMPDAEITLRRNNRNPNQDATDQIRVSNYDADNNGYLEANEVEAMPLLAQSFKAIDANGDEKLFPAELRAFLEEQSRGLESRLTLEVFDQGQDLFGLLDTDQDGVLGPRELTSADTVLATEDKDGDGELGGSEIPQQITLVVSRGAGTDNSTFAARSRTRSAPLRSARTGPTWFQKMDRNYDGDVSDDEFLGPAVVFAKLDADRDGFIDSDEADAAKR